MLTMDECRLEIVNGLVGPSQKLLKYLASRSKGELKLQAVLRFEFMYLFTRII